MTMPDFYCARCKRTMGYPSKLNSRRRRLDLCAFCETRIGSQQISPNSRAFTSIHSISKILNRDSKAGRGKLAKKY
jgi:hypothetical protein